MLKPPTFKQSRETQIIYNLFREISSRDEPVVTWREICEATGKRKEKLYGPVSTAMKRCLEDDNLVIENDHGIGYRRRKDEEINPSNQRDIGRARKIHRVALKKNKCADRSKMSAEGRSAHDVHRSVLELNLQSSRPRTIANTKQMVMRKQNSLSEEEQLQAIVDALGGK